MAPQEKNRKKKINGITILNAYSCPKLSFQTHSGEMLSFEKSKKKNSAQLLFKNDFSKLLADAKSDSKRLDVLKQESNNMQKLASKIETKGVRVNVRNMKGIDTQTPRGLRKSWHVSQTPRGFSQQERRALKIQLLKLQLSYEITPTTRTALFNLLRQLQPSATDNVRREAGLHRKYRISTGKKKKKTTIGLNCHKKDKERELLMDTERRLSLIFKKDITVLNKGVRVAVPNSSVKSSTIRERRRRLRRREEKLQGLATGALTPAIKNGATDFLLETKSWQNVEPAKKATTKQTTAQQEQNSIKYEIKNLNSEIHQMARNIPWTKEIYEGSDSSGLKIFLEKKDHQCDEVMKVFRQFDDFKFRSLNPSLATFEILVELLRFKPATIATHDTNSQPAIELSMKMNVYLLEVVEQLVKWKVNKKKT